MASVVDVLEQEEMWYGQDGYPYRVAEMEQSHRYNVLRFLRRRAENLYARKNWIEFKRMEHAPDDVFDDFMREWDHYLGCSPLEWLNSRPLVLALERHIRLHESISPDSFELPEGSVNHG